MIDIKIIHNFCLKTKQAKIIFILKKIKLSQYYAHYEK